MQNPRKGRLYLPEDRYRSSNPASPVWNFLPQTGVMSPPDVEDQVRGLLPPTGFLRSWVEWIHVLSDCPSIYNVVTWLTALSSLANPGLRVIGPGGAKFRPNLFTILVGPSGESRKTYAIQRVSELFTNNTELAERLGDSAGSLQGLVSSLQDRKDQIIFDEDMGDMLQAGQRGPVQQLKLFFNKVFDGGRVTHRLKNESYVSTDYALSYLTGINWPLLEQYSETTDFTGGLFSRFLTIDARVTRRLPAMASNLIPDSHRQRAIDYFTNALRLHQEHSPRGVIEITADAAGLINLWEESMQERHAGDRSRATLAPTFARMIPLATRIATLYAFDRFISAGPGAPQAIQLDDARYAIALVEYHLHSVSTVFGKIASTNYQRRRRVILEVIPEYNVQNQWATLGSICKQVEMEMREVKSTVETLLAEGTIRSGNVATGMGYQRMPVAKPVTVLPDIRPTPPPAPVPVPTTTLPVLSPQWGGSYVVNVDEDVYICED